MTNSPSRPYGLIGLNTVLLAQAAMAYVSMGWPVLPLEPRGKAPLGRLVKTGLKEASTDLGQVRTWWEMYPSANIGLRTGIVFDVIDLDGKNALVSLAGLAQGYQHSGPVAATGKGYHLLVAPTGARNAANKFPGIDFRGQNGYIVAPPSIHPNGHRYQWKRDGEIPEPAAWVEHIVTPKRSEYSGSGVDPDALEPIIDTWTRTFGTIEGHPLSALGERAITNCVWHDDSTPSLVLYPENNSFYCFGCNEWGDSLNLSQSFLSGGTPPSTLRAPARARLAV